LLREVRRRGLGARTLVWCTSALAVRYAVKTSADVEVAYLKDVEGVAANLDFIARARTLGARAVSADWRAVDRALVAAAHALDLRVYSFHKEYQLTDDKLGSGIDGIITDYPESVLARLAELDGPAAREAV
jgi:hypothetical protein